jgi:hypothetical protein
MATFRYPSIVNRPVRVFGTVPLAELISGVGVSFLIYIALAVAQTLMGFSDMIPRLGAMPALLLTAFIVWKSRQSDHPTFIYSWMANSFFMPRRITFFSHRYKLFKPQSR